MILNNSFSLINEIDDVKETNYEIPSNLELKSTEYLKLNTNKGNTSQKSRKLKNDSDQYYTVNGEF